MGDESNVISYVAIATSVLTAVIAAINHKRIRSSCFGSKMEVSIDIEDTTPPRLKLQPIKPPATTDGNP